MSSQSLLQKARLNFQPKLPKALQDIKSIVVKEVKKEKDQASSQLINLFPFTHQIPHLEFLTGSPNTFLPLRVGVVLSGGQAPGGHNVITGLYDALKKLNPESRLIGFLNGPSGIVSDSSLEITEDLLAGYRNQGGFDLIGSGRTKIETAAQFKAAENTVKKHQLNGLVIVGGDDSNTNAALLAEYFVANHCETSVVGIPKTIDGDLKTKEVEISFGFDTASKNYAETIGNLMRDAISAKKYYYFVKLMGRSASHITLECSLQTHPNLALISEEVAARNQSLKEVVTLISDLICTRALKGKNYGVILIPEGVVEFIPEVKKLIEELNGLLATIKPHHLALEKLEGENEKIHYISKLLSKESLSCFEMLPKGNQGQLLIGRDSHGNVQVSKIETERMLMEMVGKELKDRTKKGNYKGSFSPVPHFCGFEGRCSMPSNFDSQYCYSLGHIAAILINAQATGYICHLGNLSQSVEKWLPGSSPLTSLMTIEERHGEKKPVIQKALVDLKGKPFALFNQQRAKWAQEDDYVNPGPLQFFGPQEIVDSITLTLALEH